MNNISFSILIPTFKYKFLKECIDSIISQTYSNYEVIVVNDNSPEDIDSIINQYSDSCIRYYKNEVNCGAINVVDNWNICLSYAKGDYIICIGDDDKLLPWCLEEYVSLINKYPYVGLLHGWTEIINENSDPISLTTHRCEYESAMSLLWHRKKAYELQFIGDFCFRRDWLIENGGFYKLPLAWGSDDISAIIGASLNGVANTQKVVFQYRRNSQTISSTGNCEYKMIAIIKEFEWLLMYLKQPCKIREDELYRKQINNELNSTYNKKKGLLIGHDLKHNIFRFFFWIKRRKKYEITNKVLLYAIIQAFK